MNKAYVYELVVDGIVRYIGKGTNGRLNVHLKIAKGINKRRARGEKVKTTKFYNKLAKEVLNKVIISSKIIIANLSDEEAFEQEVIAIASFPNGQLWNVMTGGNGATAEYTKGLWADPIWRKRQEKLLKEKWDDPIYRERMLKARQDPEVRARISQTLLVYFSDPENRKRQSESLKDAHVKNPELRKAQGEKVTEAWAKNHEKFSKAVTAHWEDPEQRKRQSEAAKANWADPEKHARYSASHKAVWDEPGKREAQAERIKLQFSDPILREKLIANNPRNKGNRHSEETKLKMSIARKKYYEMRSEM